MCNIGSTSAVATGCPRLLMTQTIPHMVSRHRPRKRCGQVECGPQLAADVEADVVVMGAVSRNRWKRLFIGATAERTLEHLPCDLLIVKPDWFKTPVKMSDDKAA